MSEHTIEKDKTRDTYYIRSFIRTNNKHNNSLSELNSEATSLIQRHKTNICKQDDHKETYIMENHTVAIQ